MPPFSNAAFYTPVRLDRIEKEEPIVVDILQSSNAALVDKSLTGHTIDVSENGMKVVTGVPIPVDSRISLQLDLDPEPCRLVGEVRWASDTGWFGLQLDEDCADFESWTRMFQFDLIRD